MWRRQIIMSTIPAIRWRRPPGRALLGACIALAALGTVSRHARGDIDLSRAVVVTPADVSGPEGKAVALLVDEVRKRTLLRWEVVHAWPAEATPVIAVGPAASLRGFAGPFAQDLASRPEVKGSEGYRLCVLHGGRAAPVVAVVGNDARGVLFGVGRLLRELSLTRGKAALDHGLDVATAPRYPLRGHQLGYRPKTNSYDGWDVALWEQYIRDLAVFGTNAVELIPPRSDDDADSPHFPLPPMEMMVAMSQLCADYGLDVWIWYPAMDPDYSDPKTVAAALKEWEDVFRKLPRIDAVFVPGGDPGHTRPKHLLALLEKQTAVLHRHHPNGQMWVSPQGFDRAWLEEFYALLKEEPVWLTGVVYGPQVRVSLPEVRRAVPRRYPIRRYPDVTHSLQCQYPVADWDLAYALTEGREVINPRPLAQAQIFRAFRDQAVGFITYSEGCNDDVNKIVWSSLGWDPDVPVLDVLRQYGRYFIGPRHADDFAQGLLALERNWRGPLLTNEGVFTTLQQFRALEQRATPRDLLNWRFQQALYRAYYDAYTRRRLVYETELEERALDRLRTARRAGSLLAMREAEAVLDRAETDRPAPEWRARVFELGEALFQSIRMQLSVERYKAISVGRGATLDTLDVPLNSRPWLKKQFAELRRLDTEAARLQGIEAIVDWTDPGPGGFYDDLGNLGRQPHLVRGPGYAEDPGFLRSPLVGFARGPGWRTSWCRHAASLYDAPLRLHYDGLDPSGHYRVRVVYAGDNFRTRLRLLANDRLEVHPYLAKERDIRPVEFDVPREATREGALTLTWSAEPGRGGNGRGCQVTEVWLLKR
jgi:hypothetical protein